MQILNNKAFIRFTILSLLLYLSQVEGQYAVTPLKLGKTVDKVDINERHGFVYFSLKIPDNYNMKEDLIIKAMPIDPDSDPDIYISKTNMYPNSSSSSDWQCAAYGRDVCEILHRNISQSDTFYIGMFCFTTPCKFSVLAMLSNEFILEDGIEFQTYMHKQEAKIFKYHVQASTTKNQTIMIKASSYNGNAQAFNFRVQKLAGNVADKFQSKHSKIGQAAWKKGQVVRINSQDDQLWCTDCNLTIVLDVQDEGYYHLVATTTGITPLVYNGVQIDDMVGYGQRQCYQYNVKSEETNLQITLTTYSGHVNITAHPSYIPDEEEDFLFKPDYSETSAILDLSADIRSDRANQAKGRYYICIYAVFTSTYTLRIREFELDMRKIYLEDSYQERFYLPINGSQVLMYKAPKLEYQGEDIQIIATLETRIEGKPTFAGKMCEQIDPEECRANAIKEFFTNMDSGFTKAIQKGLLFQLVMEHDETKCNTLFKGECYYAIVLQNPSNHKNPFLYQITVSHSQNNHIFLQEGVPYMDTVPLNTFKYYKFSVFDNDAQNVSFQISPLHGDSDIFVSRNFTFPDRATWDKRGARAGTQGDHIAYKKSEDGYLNGTYYIGVYGYTYASYSIVASVVRNYSNKEQIVTSTRNHLYEGIPYRHTLHNELDLFIGFFEVDISDDQKSTILITMNNNQRKSHMYVKYGEVPNMINYHFEIVDGTIRITENDKNYHQKGIYYVTVMPKFGFWDLFSDDYYTFTITQRLENSIAYLTQHEKLNFPVQARQFAYAKHYVSQTDSSIKITYTNGGQADIFISLDPTNNRPTETSFDFSSKQLLGGNYTNVKSIYIPDSILQMKNQACVDLGYAEEESCVINIGVYCNQQTTCKGTFSLEYDSDFPTLIHIGQSKHSTIQINSWTYYYLTIPESNLEDIYAVLTPLAGDLDLYVSFQRDSQSVEDWKLPTAANYDLESKNKLKTEMIHITKENLNSCFINKQSMNENCIIIFGIYANPDYFTNTSSNMNLLYNFVTYKNIIEVKDRIPISASVQGEQMTYFLYHETCQNCTLIISLNSYASGDPDLYIVKGDRLPTINTYDIKRASTNSEVVVLDLESDYFRAQNLSSMEGYYTIGVYGNKTTSFSLSIQSQDFPIIQLTEGIQIMHAQEPFDISYYQYYNWFEKDLEIQTLVQKGKVDVLVNTYYQQNPDQSFVDLLPQQKRDVKQGWTVINVDNQNSQDGKELLIQREDHNFCKDCYYLIGIVTHEESARFNILVKALDAEKSYSHLLKIGEVKTIRLNETNKVHVDQFLLENKAPASIVPTVLSGNVKVTLSFGENKEQKIAELINGKTFIIQEKDLKTDVNYYLTTECLSDKAELTIGVQQKSSIISLQDGVPQKIEFTDDQDVSKYMLFDIVNGSSTVMINVKSKTKGFFPLLTYSVFTIKQADEIIFPKSALYPYKEISNWYEEMFLLKEVINFNENLQYDAILAINLIRKGEKQNFNQSQPAQVIITVSNTHIIKLMPDEEYFSEFIDKGAQFNIFKADPPRGKSMIVEFSRCSGFPNYQVITNLNDLNSRAYGRLAQKRGAFLGIFQPTTKPYYILVEPLEKGMSGQGKSEYTIKIKYIENPNIEASILTYYAESDGRITIDFLKGGRGEFKLSWGPLYYQKDGSSRQFENLRYSIVKSTVTNAHMDSLCAIKRDTDTFSIVDEVKNQYEVTLPRIKPGEETYFNVIAISDDEQIQYPYQPLTVTVPTGISIGGRWAIYISVALVVVFVSLACYFYKKNKMLQKQLQYEINEVENQKGGVEKYKRVSNSKDETYRSFKEEADNE